MSYYRREEFTPVYSRSRQLGRQIARLLSGFVVASLLAINSQAAGISQLEYLQWLVQLSGETESFSDNSSATDYVMWARGKGMTPKDGWNPTGKLTREALADTLAQFLRLTVVKPGDGVKSLATLGIVLPSSADVSRKDLVALIDEKVQARESIFRRPKSPNKPDRDRDKDKDRDNDHRPPPHPRDRDNDRGGPANGGKK